MKKIFAVLLLIVFASIGVLSGCDLISLNEYKYFNTIVMKIGDKEITKEILIQRYNSIGAQYVEDGYSIEQAMQITVDSIINRELVLMRAKELVTLSQNDINDVWQEVYDSVNETLQEFEGQIKAEWNVVYLNEDTEEEDNTKTYATFTPFKKEVELVNNIFEKNIEEDEEVELPIGDFIRENFDGNVDWVASGRTYDELQVEAWRRYMRALKNAEDWKKLSTVESEIFERELNRIYEIFEGNKYVQKLEEHFNNNIDVNGEEFRNLITSKYIELVQDSFAKYNLNMTSYHEKMGSDSKNVYYHPNSGNEYVYVSHVLVKYSDEQTALLESYKTQLNEGTITQVEYDSLVANVNSQISGYARGEDGKETGEPVLATSILTEIQNALSVFGTSEDDLTILEKSQKFNEFIYKYNQDDGMMNAEIPYVVNLDTEVQDKMVKPFADSARELYTVGKGSLSGLVYTEYGVHIIFYSKPVENILPYNDLLTITPEVLYRTPISLTGDKSVYDKMYEIVTKRSYQNYQDGVINELKSEVEITLYKSNYSDLIK